MRSFKGLHRSPVFFQEGHGAYLKDVEGKDYIDFCMSFGPLILGHGTAEVKKVLLDSIEKGTSFGAAEAYSLELAEYMVEHISHIEQVRFMNSGTEAVMTALRLARGYTQRNKVLKFNGCYHGHSDFMLIQAGSGAAENCGPVGKGITPGVVQDTLVVDLADWEGVEKAFKDHHQDLAAVIIEPLPANYGLLKQDPEFLKKLREITKQHGTLLIFDEVISGFRMGMGGMAEKLGLDPDLVTYGKIIGGGLPVGAVAGKKEVMECLAPIGEVYQAGTLSANPLAMKSGLAALKLLTPEVYKKIDQNTAELLEKVPLYTRFLS